MPEKGLQELYVDELKDLHNAENQLVKALPKMAKAASSEKLRAGFEEHLQQTKGHVSRLEQIFESLGESPKGKKCKGMEGLVEEGSEIIDEDLEDGVKDAGLIGAAQRVEHYEIAAYGTVKAFAETLGHSEHASLLETSGLHPRGARTRGGALREDDGTHLRDARENFNHQSRADCSGGAELSVDERSQEGPGGAHRKHARRYDPCGRKDL